MKESQVKLSVWNQCKIIFKKNLLIYKRDKSRKFFTCNFLLCYLILSKIKQQYKIRATAALFSTMSLIVLTISIVSSMITEKSDRQKETQKLLPVLLMFIPNLSLTQAFVCSALAEQITLIRKGETFKGQNSKNPVDTLVEDEKDLEGKQGENIKRVQLELLDPQSQQKREIEELISYFHYKQYILINQTLLLIKNQVFSFIHYFFWIIQATLDKMLQMQYKNDNEKPLYLDKLVNQNKLAQFGLLSWGFRREFD